MTIFQLKTRNTLITTKPNGKETARVKPYNVRGPRPGPTHHLIPQNTPVPKSPTTSYPAQPRTEIRQRPASVRPLTVNRPPTKTVFLLLPLPHPRPTSWPDAAGDRRRTHRRTFLGPPFPPPPLIQDKNGGLWWAVGAGRVWCWSESVDLGMLAWGVNLLFLGRV